MGDIHLFRVAGDGVTELQGTSFAVERSLQKLIECNLEAFLRVRFLASEYSTGKTHGGRIDTLGIDENNCPVIMEYKRSTNENVINQGLFYLDWLMDHKADFTLLILKVFGQQTANAIEWSGPRLLCIAGDYTRYDEHAVQQIRKNIELIRYRRYGDGFILLELVNSVTAPEPPEVDVPPITPIVNPIVKPAPPIPTKVSLALARADEKLRDRFFALKAFVEALGDDVQTKELKLYYAFKRLRNFACVEVQAQSKRLIIYVNVNPSTIPSEPGFTRDVRTIGHYGTGDLEITIASDGDFERAKPIIEKSYQSS